MRTPKKLTTAVAFTVGLALSVMACGDDDDGGGGQGGADAAKVAVVSTGSRTDSGFGESWWEGSQAAKKSLGDSAEITWTDGLASLDALDRGIGAALTEGNDSVLIATSEAPQLVDEYAEKFPDQWICDIEVPRKSYPPNACTIYPRFEEGGFLGGALAGLTTKSNKVGYVMAYTIPLQLIQGESFALGARYVNPDVTVSRTFTDSFSDAGKGRAAAQAQYSSGVDTILSGLDSGSKGILLAAEDADSFVVTQYTDQYEDGPGVVLSSVLYHQERISEQMVRIAAAKKLQAKSYDFGLRELGVGELAPFRGETGASVDKATRRRLEEIAQQIESGEIDLPDATTLTKEGAGDRIDPKTLGGDPG